MLHEILLGLVGHTGHVIINKTNPRTGEIEGFEVASDVDFLSPSEKQTINQLCVAGYHFWLISEFVKLHTRSTLLEPSGSNTSLYVRALCTGIDSILDRYSTTMLRLEQDIVSSPQYPVSKLHYELHEFLLIFPPLSNLVTRVKQSFQSGNGLRGGQLLNDIYQRSINGFEPIRKVFQRLLFECNNVLLGQISSWLVHGLLADPFCEFFVQRVKGNQSQDASLLKEAGGATESWNSQYNLRLSMVPSYIPGALASKILFIGRAVCILQHPLISKHGLLPYSEAVEFAKAIHNLRKADFDILEVESVVDFIRSKVSRHLWELIVLKSGLLSQLHALKDYFLLGRGEFFQCFLDEANTLMSRQPDARAVYNVNRGPSQDAAAKLGLAESPFLKRLSFQMSQPTFKFSEFQAAHFPDSTIGTGLICVGSTQLSSNHLELCSQASGQSGAVWHSPRQVVDYGFTTQWAFRASREGAPRGDFREGFAFVIQNDGMQTPPTKNASGEYMMASTGTSIAIEFVMQHAEMKTVLEISCISHNPTSSLTLAKVKSQLLLFNGQPHAVAVSYVADAKLVVHIDGQEVLNVNISLRRLLPLEAGLAYIGFMAANGDNASHNCHGQQLLSWEFKETPREGTPSDGWRNLRLEYRVDELDLILTRESFDQYNALFRLLFDTKRVQMSLQHSWTSRWKRAKGNMPVLALRARMQYLVDTLCYYIQVDVLDVQFGILLKHMQESQDFEAVRQAHVTYLAALTTHCFLRDRTITNALQDLFDTCGEFCRIAQSCEPPEVPPKDLLLEEKHDKPVPAKPELHKPFPPVALQALTAEFQRQSNVLFTLIAKQPSLHSSEQLSQLLMRIDFNRYFSLSAIGPEAVKKYWEDSNQT